MFLSLFLVLYRHSTEFPYSGPGCSSVGYGAASELGPLMVNGNGTGLEFNKFAWNNGTILLFIFYRSYHVALRSHVMCKVATGQCGTNRINLQLFLSMFQRPICCSWNLLLESASPTQIPRLT